MLAFLMLFAALFSASFNIRQLGIQQASTVHCLLPNFVSVHAVCLYVGLTSILLTLLIMDTTTAG